MQMSKSQVSFEFIMIFVLVLFALSGFIYIINQRIFELSKKQENLVLVHLSNSIINEAIIASSANNNYVRKFDIPQKLFGKDYRMSIENSELSIVVLENNQTYLEHLAVFPIPVKGSFIQQITENTTEHCVSRSTDGIRFSRTQASIDPNVTNPGLGDVFDVFISLHCVTDVASARFTIKYDPEALELMDMEAVPVIFQKQEFRKKNPLFENVLTEFPINDPELINEDIARFTFGYIGTTCESGSGNFARMKFRALKAGETEIKFDEDVNEYINILDCNTNPTTEFALPDSRNNARIVIE